MNQNFFFDSILVQLIINLTFVTLRLHLETYTLYP